MITWIEMGPWPCYVGVTQSKREFLREMQKYHIEGQFEWLPNGAVASVCELTRPKKGTSSSLTCIMQISDISEADITCQCALIAHEAIHVIQYMRDAFGDLGVEAEGYLMQYLVRKISDIVIKK